MWLRDGELTKRGKSSEDRCRRSMVGLDRCGVLRRARRYQGIKVRFGGGGI